ncbi:DUF1488 family protein [Caballeronia sp. BR00000012568055]|uniref:DUF1488 family protein n=1 Tax=Caballeronia sp. BR00000012568055 TaxID=2918761 RepID=UPI003519DB62
MSADKRSVTFIMIWQDEPVTCLISRAVLETYFWLAPDSDDARTIRYSTTVSAAFTPWLSESYKRVTRSPVSYQRQISLRTKPRLHATRC